MRTRERPGPPPLPVPPFDLLRWSRCPPPGERNGSQAYPSREQWVTARQEWAAAHGLTVREWFDKVMAEARAELRALEMLPLRPDPDADPFCPEGWDPLRDEW